MAFRPKKSQAILKRLRLRTSRLTEAKLVLGKLKALTHLSRVSSVQCLSSGHSPTPRVIRAGLGNLVPRTPSPNVPETPGLGFTDFNVEACRAFLHPDDSGVFEPTDHWTRERAHDRLWS